MREFAVIVRPVVRWAGAQRNQPECIPRGTRAIAARVGSAIACAIVAFAVASPVIADDLAITSVEPAARSLSAPVESSIVIHFDRPVQPASLVLHQSVNVFAKWSGRVDGTLTVAADGMSVTLDPSRPFSAGEQVMVILSHDVTALDGSPLRSAGYSYQFWTNARTAAMAFTQIDSLTTRTLPAQSSRAYGGIGSDLNGDGFLDITVVNEDTADLRVFMNHADRSGLFDDFLQPTFAVDDRASPSEPADFNRDGKVDICVANINTNNVSILLGNGDGTFASQQLVPVGFTPRGIAVLDVDGDGDTDVANTNLGSSSVSILLNNGSGVFGAPTFFDTGSSGEWALGAADMDQDGILDLVVGAQTAQRVVVMKGNGDGTFTFSSMQNSDGNVWMLAIGDLNGDGTEDVTVANSAQNRSAVLFGNGNGTLGLPVRYSGEAFPIATDVGDLDGDGDLDWVTSSYVNSWRVYRNNGGGAFSVFQTIIAPQAGSCAVLMDSDNDGDLDMSLIDEDEDVVLLMQNSGTAPLLGDYDDDCDVALSDFASHGPCLEGPVMCAPAGCAVFDFDDDCDVDMVDVVRFMETYTSESVPLPNCVP